MRGGMKKGILLVAFGSSRQEAHVPLMRFDARVRGRFGGVPTRWAFTSGIVRGKLAESGKKTDSVAKALEKLWFEKYTHVAVQSLHMITGKEYDGLEADVRDFQRPGREFAGLSLGGPLLGGERDVPRVVDAIMANLPAGRAPGEPVVLMGHGTWHAGDSLYDLLYAGLRERTPDVYLATMDGRLTIGDVRDDLVARGARKAWLMPLLAVPGRHVHRDMCGPGPESWVGILRAAGIETACETTGTAEFPEFADIWLDRLELALSHL